MMRLLLLPTFAATAIALAAPGSAQTAPAAAAAAAPAPVCQAGITNGARNALVALQQAVSAKDSVNIPAKLAAAQAVAKSNDDRCFIAQLQLQAAVDRNDLKAVPAALEAQLASGSIPATKIAGLYENLGKMQYNGRNYGDASTSLERSVQLEPGRASAVIMLAETRTKQNRVADAIPLYQKALAMEVAAGRVPDQNWYKRSVAVAHDAKNPLVYGIARDWVTAYPSVQNWRDAIRVYGNVSGLDDATMIDMYRLQRLTNSLAGEADFARYAQALLVKGFPGEAKAMLDAGFAANAVDRTRASVKSYHALATSKSVGDRASLDGQAKAALASGAAKQAMALGEAYYGYGEYAKSAAMYRAALGKTGVDTNLANLRLGMALAASGDKAGAKVPLALVSGPRADIARYWMAYASTRS